MTDAPKTMHDLLAENAALRAEVARLRMVIAVRDAIDAGEPSAPPVTVTPKREFMAVRDPHKVETRAALREGGK